MGDPIRVWTRPEIEEAAQREPEVMSYLRVRITMKLLKLMIDFAESNGELIEIISAHSDSVNHDAQLKFFKRG